MNSLATERSEVDALKDAQKEYQRLSNKKKFFMKKFGIFEHHAKWLQGKTVGEESSHPSSKETKTSSSNAYTRSSCIISTPIQPTTP